MVHVTGEEDSGRYNRERMFDARQHLGDGSPLEGSLPGFRVRGEQLALADAVAACLSGDGHLIAEAGTGVGKSLAYLVPIALRGPHGGRLHRTRRRCRTSCARTTCRSRARPPACRSLPRS